ncbi:MAG: CHASE3 domain-containing protein [Cyclobacteriaceae bacterium]|nr:CHASE3 domain-containing protein [Cyclobacteriaceae bacterium]
MSLTRIRIIFTVILVVLISICFLTYRNVSNYMQEVAKVRHTNEIINTTQQILSSIKDAETGHRGFQLSDDEYYLKPYKQALIAIPENFKVLDNLSKDDQTLRNKVDTLGLLINNQFRIIARILNTTKRNNLVLEPEELKLLADGRANMDSIRSLSNLIVIGEQSKMVEALENEGGFKDLAPTTFLATALIACGAVFLLFTRAVLLIQDRDVKSIELRTALDNLQKEVQIRKFTQILLRNVWDNSPDVIQVFGAIRDATGKICNFKFIMANKAATLLIDRDEEYLLSHTLLEVYPDYEGDLIEEYKEVVEKGITYKREQQFEVNHEARWFKLVAVRFEDGLVVTFSDITDDKMSALLIHKAERLSMTGKIARTIAHEIRNPLTNLNLALENLKDEMPKTETAKIYSEIISRNSNRIEKLISDLLNSSKPKELQLELISINELLEDALLLAKDRINLKNVTLSTTYASELPRLYVDREEIKIALLNIIINGIEAIDKEHGELKISTFRVKDTVRINIHDNGIGIAKSELNKLFDPFYTNKPNGTGLGLTSTLNILSSHNATVVVNSTVGAGTTFTLQFKLAEM